MMAREYGWTPMDSDEIYFYDILKYVKIIQKRDENKQNEKINEYILLVHIVHSSEPNKLVDKLRGQLPGDADSLENEICDLDKLTKWKKMKKEVKLHCKTDWRRRNGYR